MNNRWKIIVIATAFNLLFEYSLRGINNLKTQPSLPFILFPIYFTLFIMLEDLIVRYKLKAYQLMIISFFYGTIYLAYTSGIVFIKPNWMGISLIPLLYVNIVWWGALQAVLTFYLANLLSPRDWNHSRMSMFGWTVCIIINILAILVFQKSGLIPTGSPTGRFTIFIIILISLGLSILTIRRSLKEKINSFITNRFLTILSFSTVILFLFSAIFLIHDPIKSNTSNVNAQSLRIITFYTTFVALSLLTYRVITKKEISV